MILTSEPATPARPARPAVDPRRGVPAWLLFAALAGAVVALSLVNLAQGTSGIGAGDLRQLLTGDADQLTRDVFWGSRLPRLVAGFVVGAAVGVSGALLQSVTRNPLVSPDTLAVNAGSWFAVGLVSVFGWSFPVLATGAVAFLGGLASAGLVLLLSGGTSGPARLVLAGSALALALGSLTRLLIILFEEETRTLFFWGSGSLVQVNLDAPVRVGVVVIVVLGIAFALSRSLDVLSLGPDAAASLGLHVGRVRLVTLLVAVLLSSLALTVAGPMGFIGLCAPVLARQCRRFTAGAHRHRMMLPLAGVIGVTVVLAADVVVRLVPTEEFGTGIPTGVATTIVGAIALVAVARGITHAESFSAAPTAHPRRISADRRTVVALIVLATLLLGSLLLGLLAGDGWLLTGDLVNWATGQAGPYVHFTMDERVPRLLAATLAGGALALAGCGTQAVCRNPLAEPGLLGVTAGAGVGAVSTIALIDSPELWQVNVGAVVGALLTFSLVYAASWRGGLDSIRMILVGVGVAAGAEALIAALIILTSPWDIQFAMTWLSGSTYGRTLEQVWPVAILLVIGLPLMLRHRGDLDVMALDDDVPRVLGVRLERVRTVVLVLAALLTATSAAAVGIVAFVGLVAPHAARALVGGRHVRAIPVAVLLGMVLVGLADTLGRSVIAPEQVPAGVVTALVGAPYFVWLLWRTRG